jgi:hypothetical protein
MSMSTGDANGQWRLESVEPPPFEKTRLLELTEQTLPVRPLRSPFERALILAILALGLGALALVITSLRADLGKVSWAVAYGPASWELLAGAGVFWLAMRWSVPGSGVKYSRSSVFLGTAMALALAAALAAPHLVSPDHPGLCVGSAPGKGLQCAGWQLVIAIPVFLVSLWFILRGATVSSVLAGALAGLGAGLLSDAAIHLHCPAIDPSHTVTWHLGAVALLTSMGALLGKMLPKW